MNDMTRILIVEDLISDFELAQREIRKSFKLLKNCVFERVEKQRDFLKALEDFQPDLILSDYKLPSFDGMKALELAQKHTPSTPFLIWSGVISEDAAVECMKKGASNYIFKENLKRLGPAVVHALEERQLLLEHKQAEARYQAIFDNSVEGIFQSTPDGHFINVNPAMARIYGYDSPQEMIKSVAHITRQLYIDPAERGEFAELLQTRKAIENYEGRNYRKDGSIIWTSTSARIVHDNDGNVLYYEGFLQDITERKQAEDALKNNERRFRVLIENGLDSISLLAADGTLQWESPAITRILDFAPGEFLGHNIFELMHPDDLVWTRSLFTKLLQEPGSRQHKSFRLRHFDGSWRWVEAVVTNMLDEPTVQAVVVNYRDVTERMQVEETIKAERNLLRTLIDNLPDRIYVMDNEGRKTISNTSDWKASGVKTMEDVIGKTDFDTYPPELAEQFWELDRAVLDSGQPVIDYEEPGLDFEGNPLSILTTKIPLRGADGKVSGLVGIGRDITERKRVETERLALLEIMQGLANTNDLQEFLKLIHNSIAKVIYAENFFVVFYRQESGLFEEIYTVDQYDPPALPSSLEKSITSYVFRSGEPLLLTLERFDELVAQGEVELVGTNSASWLGVPLKTSNGTIGVIVVQDYENVNRYIENDKNFLESIASQAALAIERKQTEESLRAEREKAQKYLDIAGVMMLAINRDGLVTLMNQKGCEILGYSEDEIIGKNWIQTCVPELIRAEMQEAFRKLISGEGETIGYYENTVLTKNGEERLIAWHHTVVHDVQGTIIGTLSSGEDITERKRTEDAEREQRALAEALRDSAETLNSTLDYGGVLDRILAAVGRVVPHNAATIMLIDGESAHVVRSHGYDKLGFDVEIMGIRLPLAETNNLRQMLETGKTVIVHDTHSYPGWKRLSTTDWLRSNVGAPISSYGKVIGFILLDSETVGFFTPVHAERLEAFANQAALAIHNANMLQQAQQEIVERKQAEEEISRRAEETAALLETSLALTDLDLNAILQSIGNSAKTLFTADGCRIFLMQPDGESLRCALALQENSNAFYDLILKLGDGVTGAVAASGQAEIVNEMQNDPRGVQVPGTINEEEEAIMFAPLKERDRTIGVLSIRRAGTERPFKPADLELLEAFASMAASAVSNARLFEEAQQRLAELEALYENGLAVGQLLEPAGIGARIIETFARHLSWHHVAIRLLHPETDDMELIAFNQPGLSDEERYAMERHFNKMINKVGQGLSGWVVQTGEPLRTGNVHSNPQYGDTHAATMSGLYMPLKVGERIIGCISVESEQADAFTAQDERLLATLANQAAIAFENARLYNTAQQELLERKRAQDALWASETHYRELADSITDILFEMDHEKCYTHWNKATEMLTGIPSEDAIGRSMREVFGDSEEQTRIGKIYESVLESRQAKTFETEIVIEGQGRAFEINAYPSTRGVAVVAKDVTERKLAESLMQKRFELMDYSAPHSLNELMQRTIDEVSELTGSTIGFFHFVELDQITLGMQTWSTNARRLFHVAVSEGTHLPLDQAGTWAEAARQRRPLIQNDYQSLSQKKDLPHGHVEMVREMIIPIIRNEKIVAVMGVGNKPQDYTPHDLEIAERLADYAWDITERKQMESALADERNQLARRIEERTADLSRANSNLARALLVKDEFLANMSHELRTPLNAILGLSESLGEQVAGPLNEKQQKYLTTINESGHHLLSLINDILDLAKIEAGQITLDINKVDVNSVCQASLRMIKQLAQKKDQEVIFEIDRDLGLMWADERRLKQMIVNLLSNAVKFTPEAGKLGLEVHGDRAGNKVIITVWDNGIGISERDMNRLFRPFVQLDAGLAREATGTGLGLALVAQMARLHGGSVNVISEPGEGSRFSIQLPWEPALVADPAVRLRSTAKFRAIDPNAKNKPTILLIEDTREVVMMLVDYLEMAGFHMVTAQDGVDGLTQAKLTHPNLILMDIQMPRMDGFETTQKLRSDPQFKDTPIIALTALAMPNDRQRCIEAGMDEYMSKPVNLKALLKMLHKFLLENEEANR